MTKTISSAELKAKLDRGDELTVLEALPVQYYKKAHIPGAINFPLEDVEARASALLPNKGAEIVIYCANSECENSSELAEQLSRLGYRNLLEYREGKAGWMNAGFPVVRGNSPTQVETASCCG